MIYQFKDSMRLKGDPQVIGDTLEQIRKDHGGGLTTQHVVVAAKPKKSVLHGYFEWDDKVAARKHRLEQARYIIRAIVIVADGAEDFEPVRAFVNVTVDDDNQFNHIVSVMKDKSQRAQVVKRAKAELGVWRNRYNHLKAFAELFGVIDEVLAK